MEISVHVPHDYPRQTSNISIAAPCLSAPYSLTPISKERTLTNTYLHQPQFNMNLGGRTGRGEGGGGGGGMEAS